MRILFFLILGLFAHFCFAQDPNTTDTIGQVIWVKGQVIAYLPEKEKRPLARKSPVFKLDTLESEKASTAQINFTDGTLLALAENTKIFLESYEFNKKDPSKDSYVMSITKGGLRTITGEIAKQKPENYKTKTPIATLAVAGTDIVIKINGQNVLIGVKSGKINVTTFNGKVVTLDAKTQSALEVDPTKAEPTLLKSFPADLQDIVTAAPLIGDQPGGPGNGGAGKTGKGGGGGVCFY